jgi:hypothetical protein
MREERGREWNDCSGRTAKDWSAADADGKGMAITDTLPSSVSHTILELLVDKGRTCLPSFPPSGCLLFISPFPPSSQSSYIPRSLAPPSSSRPPYTSLSSSSFIRLSGRGSSSSSSKLPG